MPEDIIKAAHDLAEKATERKVFNFAQTVLDRSYPEIDVKIYLDEAKTQRLVDHITQISEMDARIVNSNGRAPKELGERMAELVAAKDALVEELNESAYTVRIKGISTEKREELLKEAVSKFPIEYEESTSPITGAVTRKEKDSDERDAYFVNLLRHAHLKSITAPDGAVDDDFTVEDVAATWRRLPLVARSKIDDAINKSTVTVDFYREIVDEVF